MESKYKKLASDTIIFAIGNVLVKVIQFFLLPLYTSAMTTDQYGTAELVNNLSELLYPIFCVCIYEALFRLAMDQDVDKKQLFTNGIVVLGITFPICAVIMFILHRVAGFKYAALLLFLLIAVSIRTILAQFARGIGYLKEFAFSGIVNVLSLFVFNMLLLVRLKMGISAYLVSLMLGNVVSMLYLFVRCKLYKYFTFSVDLALLKTMLKYCLPLIPNTFTWWFMNIFDRYVVLFFCGAELAGIFTAACKLPSVINLCSTVFQQAWQISSARELSSSDSKVFFSNVFITYSAFVTTVCSLLMLCSKVLASFLLKGEFYAGWVYLPVLMLSAMFNSYAIYFGTMYNAVKKTSQVFYSTVVGTMINIGLIFSLIQVFGVFAALFAMLLGNVIIAVYRLLDTRKYLKIDYSIPFHVVMLCCVVVQTIIMTLNVKFCTLISAGIFVLILIWDCILFGPKGIAVIRSFFSNTHNN